VAKLYDVNSMKSFVDSGALMQIRPLPFVLFTDTFRWILQREDGVSTSQRVMFPQPGIHFNPREIMDDLGDRESDHSLCYSFSTYRETFPDFEMDIKLLVTQRPGAGIREPTSTVLTEDNEEPLAPDYEDVTDDDFIEDDVDEMTIEEEIFFDENGDEYDELTVDEEFLEEEGMELLA
jgi:hypothetical protein